MATGTQDKAVRIEVVYGFLLNLENIIVKKGGKRNVDKPPKGGGTLVAVLIPPWVFFVFFFFFDIVHFFLKCPSFCVLVARLFCLVPLKLLRYLTKF